MRNIYLITAALASMILASCMNEEFVGDTPQTGKAEELNAIAFNGGTSALTRADFTGAQAAEKLGNQFLVYGVKQNRTTTTNYDKVFPNFTVKYNTDKDGNADYNDGWYYVDGTQTIRYWDYSSADYHFVAGSPVANFTFNLDGTTGDIKTATITGLGGRLNHTTTVASTATPVYIADPVVMTKPTPAGTLYGEVKFTFKSMQSKARVGIYETIPGYKITSITFYNNDATPVGSNYITLNSGTTDYFQGCTAATGTVTYNWTTTTPTYTFAYETTGLTKGKFWEGGQFTNGVEATSSVVTASDINKLYGTETNKDENGYFVVMPTPSGTTAAPLTIKCDYILKSLDNIDEIHVSGATATIPAAYTEWKPNTAYTYLFKITDNTNGSSGTPGTDPEGLYPITFDAVVVNVADQQIGTETTVSTPSITVKQAGNVVENGIIYVGGDDAIEVIAMEGTTDVTSTATWSYTTLANQNYDYGKDYEHLGTSGAETSWTSGKPTSVTAGTPATNYVIKAKTSNGTAYFVLVVKTAETGPAN